MIGMPRLQIMIEETADVPQLADINAALKELLWHRLNQGKLDRKLDSLRKSINEVRPKKTGRMRALMARLKF